jgi:hypothetical protein
MVCVCGGVVNFKAAESRIDRVLYSGAEQNDETFYSCRAARNPHRGAAVPALVFPTKHGAYFHASSTPSCVCDTYGYAYVDGAVAYDQVEVLRFTGPRRRTRGWAVLHHADLFSPCGCSDAFWSSRCLFEL